MVTPLEPTPGAALLTTIFGCMGYFGWPKVTSPILGGCPHGGVQCQLRLIRERQRLVGSQPTWQCLHKFELSEPVGHPAPPGLWKGRDRSHLQQQQDRPRDKLHTAFPFLGVRQSLPSSHCTPPKRPHCTNPFPAFPGHPSSP